MKALYFLSTPHDSLVKWLQYFMGDKKPKRKKNVHRISSAQLFEPNTHVSILDEVLFLEHQLSLQNKVTQESDRILVQGIRNAFDRNLRLWLREQAKVRSQEMSDIYAQKLGVTFNKVFIKDMKTRWGSCSSKGNLNYNWRLILAPARVFNYLCAHEVSHLIHKHHQTSFWETVKELHPTYQQDRVWLKTNGHTLWKYG